MKTLDHCELYRALSDGDRARVRRTHADFDFLEHCGHGNKVWVGTTNISEPYFRISVVLYATLYPEKDVRYSFGNGSQSQFKVPPGCPWQELPSE